MTLEANTEVGAAQSAEHLEKTLGWKDAFALAMAVSGGLFASFGFTMAAVGALAALALWATAAAIGMIQNWIFSEMGAMFPEKPGGLAVFANEGWRTRFSLAGPIAAFGYWFGWSAVLSIISVSAGALIQAQWFPGVTWKFGNGIVQLGLPQVIGMLLIVAVWLPNAFGAQAAVWVSKLMGVLLLIPFLVFAMAPFVSGNWNAQHLAWGLGGEGSSWWTAVRTAAVWLYLISWTAYGTEMCAAFAPEYKTGRDMRLALRTSGTYTFLVFTFVPLGLGGLATTEQAAANPSGFFIDAFGSVLGGTGLDNFVVLILVGALMMALNAALADGSRALYGSAIDGLTLRQFGVLNRHHVPGRAMLAAVLLNLFLIVFVSSPLAILVAANLGYLTAVLLALSAFLILRLDRPDLPRPVRLPSYWVIIAFVLVIYTAGIIAIGASSAELTGYGGAKELLIGTGILSLSVVFYVVRRVWQDGQSLQMREKVSIAADNYEPSTTL